MAETRSYLVPGLDLAQLAQELSNFYHSEENETQILNGPGGGYVVQTRGKDFFRKGVAFAVTLTQKDDTLTIQMGSAKWVTQALSGVFALIIFWPLLALPAYVVIKQRELMQDTWEYLERYITGLGGSVVMPQVPTMATVTPAQAAATPAVCPACGEPVRLGAKFCDSCGASLVRTCAGCGAELRPSSKFCDHCGLAVHADVPGTMPDAPAADASPAGTVPPVAPAV